MRIGICRKWDFDMFGLGYAGIGIGIFWDLYRGKMGFGYGRDGLGIRIGIFWDYD
jgi:hypothetical protein